MLCHDRRSVGQSVLGLTTRFVLLSESCGSVHAGRSAVDPRQQIILASQSNGTRGHILLPQTRDSPNLDGQVPGLISPRNSVAQYTPRHWIPFNSPPRSRRVTVEVFDTASRGADVELACEYTPII
jgi:hypothetical protein